MELIGGARRGKKKNVRMDDENDGRICGASLLLVTEGSERDVSEVKKFLRDDWQHVKLRELLNDLEETEEGRVLVGSVKGVWRRG